MIGFHLRFTRKTVRIVVLSWWLSNSVRLALFAGGDTHLTSGVLIPNTATSWFVSHYSSHLKSFPLSLPSREFVLTHLPPFKKNLVSEIKRDGRQQGGRLCAAKRVSGWGVREAGRGKSKMIKVQCVYVLIAQHDLIIIYCKLHQK